MRAWDGNPCIVYFAVSTYVADYYANNDTAAMEVVKHQFRPQMVQMLSRK